MPITIKDHAIERPAELKELIKRILKKHSLYQFVREVQTFSKFSIDILRGESTVLSCHDEYSVIDGIREISSSTILYDFYELEKTRSLHKYVELLIIHEGKHAEYSNTILQKFETFKKCDEKILASYISAAGVLSEIYADYEVSKLYPTVAREYFLSLFQFDLKSVSATDVWRDLEQKISYKISMPKIEPPDVFSPLAYRLQMLLAIRYALEHMSKAPLDFMYSNRINTKLLAQSFERIHSIVFGAFKELEEILFDEKKQICFEDEGMLVDIVNCMDKLLKGIVRLKTNCLFGCDK